MWFKSSSFRQSVTRSSSNAVIALTMGGLFTTAALASVGTQAAKLLPGDGASGDTFGNAVAIDGSIAVIGAVGADSNGSFSGSAYVHDALTGQETAKLLAADGETGDRFGAAVAISGSTVVVGALADNDRGSDSGSAYVFDAHTGQQLFKLVPGDGAAGDFFGSSVAVSGTTAIIGASGDDDNGSSSGSAYLFDTTTGQEIAKLLPNDGTVSDQFGLKVGISGSTAIVGAIFDDDNGTDSGSAYLFDTTTGQQTSKLHASDAAQGDWFGSSVGISGSIAIVGAYKDDDNGSDSGSAYLFDTATGQEINKIHASDGAQGDWFGFGVSISGEMAAVGAKRRSDVGSSSGAAYLFDVNTGQEVSKLRPLDGASMDEFGYAVAISGEAAVIGARFDDDNGSSSGSAYTFEVGEPVATPYCFGSGCPCGNDDPGAGCVNASGAGSLLSASGTNSVGQDDLVLRTESMPASTLGMVFMGMGQASPPFGNGLRCVVGATYRFGPPRNSGPGGVLTLGPGVVAASCATAPGCITPFSTWRFQTWHRDSGGPCGASINTSNALSITFAP